MDKPHYDVFLSHNSRDKPAVERLADKLVEAGLRPWFDARQLTQGGRWQDEIASGLAASRACAIFIGPHGIGDWVWEELGLATDRAVKDRTFRLFPVLLPGVPAQFDPVALPPFLRTRNWVDLRHGYEDSRSVNRLVAAIRGLSVEPDAPAADDVCPYRGLQVFDEAHAEFFFGREADTQRLLEKLKGDRFLAVLGASGSGKSSLVRAGLIPALRDGGLPGSHAWMFTVLTPGPRPLEVLAAHLARLQPERPVGATLDRLAAEPRTLHLETEVILAGSEHAHHTPNRVVLVVDQGEEVFTLCRDETERSRFFDNLLYAAGIPGGRCIVIYSLRADFYARCAAYPDVAVSLAAHQYLVGPLSEEGLRRAIEDPARKVGLTFEDGLVETILDDVARQPGSLPLLEHALLELWERRRGKLLTLQAYRESGGVAGAIAKRADTVFESLPEDQRPLVRRVMLRLTEPGEGTEDTRRRATLDELVTDPTRREAVEAAVAALTDARLLTVGSTADESAPVVDVAHEALIRGWPRLRTWLDEDRAGLRLHRRLAEAAQEWQRLGEDEGALYRGSRLTEALEFRERHPDTINELERRFLAAGAALRDAELLQRERARRARERLQRRIGAALAVGLLVAATLAILAWTQRGEAQAGRRGAVQAQQTADARRVESDDAKATAEVRRLEAEQAQQTAESRRHEAETARSDADVQKAAAVAARATADIRRIEAENAEATAEARRQEAAAAQQTAEASGKEAKDQAATAEANRAEANRQATVATEQKAETERQAAQVKQARLRQLAAQAVNEPAGDRALLLGAEAYRLSPDTVESRSGLLTTLSRTPQLSAFLQGHNGETSAVAVSPDGSIIAGGDGSIIMLWDAATYKRLATLDDGQSSLVRSLAISPNGRMLAVGRGSGTISLWDLPTRQLLVPVVDERGDSVRSVSFNASGEQLAAASHDGTVLIWDVARQSVVDVLHGSPEGVSSVAYSPDDRFVVAGLEDGHVAVWDATERRLLRYLPVSNWVADVSVAFDPEGVLFAAGAFPGVVTLWSVSDDANTWEQISRPVSTPFEYVQDIDFGPNGKWLAASSLDGRIIAWDASTFVVTGTDSELGALAVATTELYAGYATVVFGIAFAGGDRLVSTLSITTLPGAESESGAVIVWDLAADSRLATRVAGLQAAGDLAFIAGSQLLVPGPEGLSAWDPATRAVVPERVIRGDDLLAAAVTTDGRTIAVAREDGGIDLWNAASWTQIGPSLPSQGEAVVALAFSRDGTLLAGISEHSVLLWDLRTRTSLDPLTTTSATLTSLAFGKDGLLAIGSDKRVGLWDTTNRVRINSFEEEANRLAFNPDGTLLAVATYIEIVLWDVQASRVVDRLVNPLSLSIGVVAFDPSGGLLAGGGANGVLILWDISSRLLLGVLSGSSSVRPLISSIAFSPDGNTVAASDRDGAISVYPVRPSDWVARACAIAGRNLTLAEWSAYLSDTPYEFVCPPVPEGPKGTPVARRRKDSPSTIGRH